MKKKITQFIVSLMITVMAAAIPVSAESKDDFPTMPVMSRAEFDREMMEMGNAINEKNDISDDEIAAERGTYAASYDPRSAGKVSGIRRQVGGSCWVYSAIAMTEMNLIKKGYEKNTVDLSEFHALYFYNKKHVNVTLTTVMDMGGTEGKIFGDMIDGTGPVYESTVPFPSVDNYSDYDNVRIDDSLMYQQIYEPYKHDGIEISSKTEGINEGKRLITEYGAFMVGLYQNGDYLKYAPNASSDMTYYMPADVNYVNHAITIVGWNDAYPATNFKKTAPGPGAWLAKQSYGTEHESSGRGTGFMWISYYDGSIDGEAGAYEFVKPGVTAKTITLSPLNQTMERGGASATISATVSPASAQDKTLVWSSSDESIATVSQTGVVTPVGKGTCDIIAKAKVGFAESKCSVTVTAPLKEIQLSAKEITVVKGDKFKLYDRGVKVNLIPSDTTDDITYLSSDSSIVEIVKDWGTEFIAKKAGKSIITIQSEDGKVSNSLAVNVAESGVTNIERDGFGESFVIELDSLGEMKDYELDFKISAGDQDGAKKNINVTEDNPGVVTYYHGFIKSYYPDGDMICGLYLSAGYRYGQTTITLRSDDELHQECKVTIIVKQKQGQAIQPSAEPTGAPPEGKCSSSHSWVVKTVKATEKKNGVKTTICSRCSTVNKTEVIPKVMYVFTKEASYTYTGKEIKPRVYVTDSSGRDISASCSVVYKDSKKIGEVYAIVQGTGDYSFTDKVYFQIVPKPAKIKRAKRKGSTLEVTWTKQSKQTDGYELAYSTKKSFPKSATKTVKVKNSKTVKKSITKVKKKTYYVRIRTYKTVGKKKYYSSWSKAVKSR